ncbi:MAG: mechanosensitive ion channel family protein [Flavobacteriales bacterium]|nr:mechanosensitive ion channel family protein [Flavobacteriales bacterium]
MFRSKVLLIFILCLGYSTVLFSQEKIADETVTTVDSSFAIIDSINSTILNTYNAKIALIEKQRVEDSIKKVELEKELTSLKTTDNLKKEELLQQLNELNEHESNRIAQKKAEIDALRSTAKGYPVKGFFNEDLFLIYTKLGSFSAIDRANAISERIAKIGNHFGFDSTQMKVVSTESALDIEYGDQIIMSVTESDAIWNSVSKEALAQQYKEQITSEVTKYQAETSWTTLSKEIGLAILVIIVVYFLIKYVGRVSRWSEGKIRAQVNIRIKGIKIKNYTLWDAQQQVNVLVSANKFLKWLINILIVYIALPVLFTIFPWTKDFSETLFGYILNPVKKIAVGIWEYLPNLITIIVIVIVFRYVIKGLRFLKNEIEAGHLELNGFYKDWANPTYQIVKVLVFAFMVVVIFPYLPGSDSHIFQGVSVFLGFLFTFGSAGSLSNIVAGLVLTYMRLFKIGDRVKIGEVIGDVIEKSMLVTRIRTVKNEIISIPNSTVMNSHTVNYSSDAPDKGLIIHTTLTIGYDVAWQDVYQAFIDAALRTDLLLKEPKPFVLQTSLDDFYVSYQLNAYTRDPNKQAKIYSDLHQNIQDVCNERGIEILSPHYRAARDGNHIAVPSKYIPKDYKAPSFGIKIEDKNDH